MLGIVKARNFAIYAKIIYMKKIPCYFYLLLT